jgi:PleD family two-component response regulator
MNERQERMSKIDILVVDDQTSVCKEIASFLKSDYTVHAFKSGQEALDYLEGNTVDFILLDYYMPGMTGFEVLMAIRKNMSTKETPVVFLTSETNERMTVEMMGRGATDYLCKPVNAAELQQCIKKHLA